MTQEISDELRAEIVAAVEAAGVNCHESVCDWVLDAARRGGDWLAELASAVETDRQLAGDDAADAEVGITDAERRHWGLDE